MAETRLEEVRMFEGSGVALITPFRKGKIDEPAYAKLVEEQITAGTQVLIPCGTTGESATLTHEEHNHLIALTVQVAAKRVLVLAGAGSNSTLEAIHLTQKAKEAGADGTLHICPYYNKPSQEGLYRHFQSIAQATEFPLVLYNIPGRTGVNLSVETIFRLSQISCIIGIKEASGSLTQVSEIIERCGKNFTVVSGEDALTYPMLALGAKGAISVTANLFPKKCAAMFAAVEQGDWDSAKKVHYELALINRVLFIETNPAPIKAALALIKKIEPDLRLPLVELQEANQKILLQALRHYGLV